MKLIVNADDFGMDENASMAIAESFKRGYINQTTLMVNMPWAEKAVELARREGFADRVGLHCNLTVGMPLTGRIAKLNSFCNEFGEFDKRILQRRLLLLTSYECKIIKEEITAQVKRYCNLKLPLMHCDSHHHVHWKLPVLKLLLPILQRNNFNTVRSICPIQAHGLGGVLRKFRNEWFNVLVARHGIKSTGIMTDPEYFSRHFHFFKDRQSVELMVHPYFSNGRLINITEGDFFRGPLMADSLASVFETIGVENL